MLRTQRRVHWAPVGAAGELAAAVAGRWAVEGGRAEGAAGREAQVVQTGPASRGHGAGEVARGGVAASLASWHEVATPAPSHDIYIF